MADIQHTQNDVPERTHVPSTEGKKQAFYFDTDIWELDNWRDAEVPPQLLYFTAGSFCAEWRSKGYIRSDQIEELPGGFTIEEADKLVETGLWIKAPNGYQYNPDDEGRYWMMGDDEALPEARVIAL